MNLSLAVCLDRSFVRSELAADMLGDWDSDVEETDEDLSENDLPSKRRRAADSNQITPKTYSRRKPDGDKTAVSQTRSHSKQAATVVSKPHPTTRARRSVTSSSKVSPPSRRGGSVAMQELIETIQQVSGR